MPFAPGQSGNPSGRSKEVLRVIHLAQEHGPAAIAALAAIMNDQGAAPASRVTAAQALLDRGFGKPKQEIQATGSLSIAVVTGIDRAPGEPDADHD